MQILLTHPKHGSKFAMLESEALADEKNGWVRYTPPAPEPVNELEIVRRGRPRKILTEGV
jgi:hypothetical protein